MPPPSHPSNRRSEEYWKPRHAARFPPQITIDLPHPQSAAKIRSASPHSHLSLQQRPDTVNRMPTPPLQILPPRQETPFPFLCLPGELRTLIYHHVFAPEELTIDWLDRTRDLTYRLPGEDRPFNALDAPPEFYRRRQQLALRDRARNRDRDPARDILIPHVPGPAALLLVNRQVHAEARHVFYGNHTFRFTNRKVLFRFLSTLPPASKTAIRKLSVVYEYQSPEAFYGDGRAWRKTCLRAAEELTGLAELRLQLRTGEKRGLRCCVGPWLSFRGRRGLRKVDVETEGDIELFDSASQGPQVIWSAGVLRSVLLRGVYGSRDDDWRDWTGDI